MSAQYTEVINSNRPGISESPYSTGLDVLQTEIGLSTSSIDTVNTNSSTHLRNISLQFREGAFNECFEFNGYYSQDFFYTKPEQSGYFDGHTTFGIGAGVKYMIYEPTYSDRSNEIRSWKSRTRFDTRRLIPTVGASILVGASFTPKLDISFNTNISTRDLDSDSSNDNTDSSEEDSSAFEADFIFNTRVKAAILLQNNLGPDWVVVTNLTYDKTGDNLKKSSLTMSSIHTLDDFWSVYGELNMDNIELDATKGGNYFIGGGGAYLLNKNLQLDASVRANFGDFYTGVTFGIGISWRTDDHVDPPPTITSIKEQEDSMKAFEKLVTEPKNEDEILPKKEATPKKGKQNNENPLIDDDSKKDATKNAASSGSKPKKGKALEQESRNRKDSEPSENKRNDDYQSYFEKLQNL